MAVSVNFKSVDPYINKIKNDENLLFNVLVRLDRSSFCVLMKVDSVFHKALVNVFKMETTRIFSFYVNAGTPLDDIISKAKIKMGSTSDIPQTLSVIQKNIVETIRGLDVLCPRIPLTLSHISHYNSRIEDMNLGKSWAMCRLHFSDFDNLQGLPSSAIPSNWESVEKIRAFMLEHQHRVQSITHLILDGRTLTCVPQETKLFSNLATLNLANNYLTYLREKQFHSLVHLQILRLNNNNLKELPKNIFQTLSQLWELSLKGNQLTELPKELFQPLVALECLDVSNNFLTELDEELFHSQTALKTLHLGGNFFADLPDGLFECSASLETLNLEKNPLTQLSENLFTPLDKLKHLGLNDNRLSELPDSLFMLDGLQKIDIGTHNPLCASPEGLFKFLSQLYDYKSIRLGQLWEEGIASNTISQFRTLLSNLCCIYVCQQEVEDKLIAMFSEQLQHLDQLSWIQEMQDGHMQNLTDLWERLNDFMSHRQFGECWKAEFEAFGEDFLASLKDFYEEDKWNYERFCYLYSCCLNLNDNTQMVVEEVECDSAEKNLRKRKREDSEQGPLKKQKREIF